MAGFIFRILFFPLDWLDRKLWKRWYGREVQYFTDLQRSIEQEHVEMGKRWAFEDLHLVARGEQPRGVPRGTPALALRVYQDCMGEDYALPVELPKVLVARGERSNDARS